MNDHDLKNFLKKGESTPKAPRGEWQEIKSKIESPMSEVHSVLWKSKKHIIPTAFLVFALFFILFPKQHQQKELTKVEKAKTLQFFIDDSLLNQDDLYSWVE